MELLITKLVTAIILGLCSFVVGVAAIKFRSVLGLQTKAAKRSQTYINSILLCFGAGVLLATALLHILPETRHGMEEAQESLGIGWLAELVFCVGFFLVYLVEEVVHLTLHRTPHREQIHTTLALRDPSDKADSACNTIEESCGTDCNTIEEGRGTDCNTIEETCGTDCHNDMQTKKENDLLFDTGCGTGCHNDREITKENNLDTGHGHSHLPAGSSSSPLRDFFTVLALSFHSVFEGLAVGLEKHPKDVWALFTAIAAHKFVIVFCVSLELLQTGPTMLVFFSYLVTFSLVTPVGIGLGMIFSGDDLSLAVLQGLAGGTILYVVMFEVLQREKEKEVSGIFQLLGIVLGFSAMMVLEVLAHHDHCYKKKGGLDQNATSLPWIN
eukprot:TRINITY_DN5852_c0_g1_i1.p1 TRINITY_DN5852_c0_g1~~TRINITY_DN5852_c0_g1_i1.p1  ORF type:complete len:384 (-),score=70.16 TRINITY_DN5852_c0_g1_i1:90-1241(-)